MVDSLEIGVLALQGAYEAHVKALARAGARGRLVRYPCELEGLGGLVIPGGESNTIARLLGFRDMGTAIINAAKEGMPIFGTCMGLIIMSRRLVGESPILPLLDAKVERNAYGRQVDSFEASIMLRGDEKTFPGIFIRAPKITHTGNEVEELGTCGEDLVLCRMGNLLGATFHPELTSDRRIHRMFCEMARSWQGG